MDSLQVICNLLSVHFDAICCAISIMKSRIFSENHSNSICVWCQIRGILFLVCVGVPVCLCRLVVAKSQWRIQRGFRGFA